MARAHERKRPEWGVKCDGCDVEADEPCLSKSGEPVVYFHKARSVLAGTADPIDLTQAQMDHRLKKQSRFTARKPQPAPALPEGPRADFTLEMALRAALRREINLGAEQRGRAETARDALREIVEGGSQLSHVLTLASRALHATRDIEEDDKPMQETKKRRPTKHG